MTPAEGTSKVPVSNPEGTEVAPTPAPTPRVEEASGSKEGYMKVSDVKALIAEAIAQAKSEGNQPIKVKRITEHTTPVYRFDSKWVVDFKDRNTDPYVKEKVHSYQKFNEQRREFEAWIEIVFSDGMTKDIPLTTYVKNRVPILCPIIKRHKIDRSYSIGEVEKKKEVGDKYVGSGIVVDQEVTVHEEVLEIRTPDKQVFMIPSYAIA